MPQIAVTLAAGVKTPVYAPLSEEKACWVQLEAGSTDVLYWRGHNGTDANFQDADAHTLKAGGTAYWENSETVGHGKVPIVAKSVAGGSVIVSWGGK